MKWLKKLVSTRLGRIKILWTITFLLLVITLLFGMGQPLFTSTVQKQLESLADGQKNKSLYDSWHESQKNIDKIQGYEYKDPRDVKHVSAKWSWKWGIGLFIFFVITAVYTAGYILQRGGVGAKTVGRQLTISANGFWKNYQVYRLKKLELKAKIKSRKGPKPKLSLSKRKGKELPEVKIGDSVRKLFSINLVSDLLAPRINKSIDSFFANLVNSLKGVKK